MKIVSREEPLQHYHWGNACDGWNLVEEPSLSVKQEKMPAGTSETLHYHEHAQQFFFILKGSAVFEIEEEEIVVGEQQGIHIPAGKKHRISNKETADLEFILSSQPSAKGDRINL